MSASISLPSVSAKIVGDASGLVSELKRGETATSVSTAKMDADLTRLSNGLRHKFSLGGIGKELFRGLGVGSGFAVAETISGKIADHFKEAAEAAKEIEESLGKQLAATEAILRLRRTDAQELTKLQADLASLLAQRDRVIAPKTSKFRVPTDRFSFREVERPRGLTDAENNEAAKLAKEAQEKQLEIDKLTKSMAQDGQRDMDKWTEKIARYNQELERTGKAITEKVQTPVEKYTETVKSLNDALQKGAINSDIFNRASEKAKHDLVDSFAQAPKAADVDRFTRIGLVGGAGDVAKLETRKQTGLLKEIRDILARANGPAQPAQSGYVN